MRVWKEMLIAFSVAWVVLGSNASTCVVRVCFVPSVYLHKDTREYNWAGFCLRPVLARVGVKMEHAGERSVGGVWLRLMPSPASSAPTSLRPFSSVDQ